MQKHNGLKTILIILLLSVTNFVGLIAIVLYFIGKKYNPSLRKSLWKWMSAGQEALSESPRNVNQNSSGEFFELEIGDTNNKVEEFIKKKKVNKAESISKRSPQKASATKPKSNIYKSSAELNVGPEQKLVAYKDLSNQKISVAGLNERQNLLLSYIKSKKQANMRDINLNFKNVSQRTLRRDMERLEKLRYVRQSGKTRDSMYEYMVG